MAILFYSVNRNCNHPHQNGYRIHLWIIPALQYKNINSLSNYPKVRSATASLRSTGEHNKNTILVNELSTKLKFNWKVLSQKSTRLSWTQIQTVQSTDGAGETYDKKIIWWNCSWNNSILMKVLLVFSCMICICKSTTKVPFSSSQSKIAQFCNWKPTQKIHVIAKIVDNEFPLLLWNTR